MTAHAVRLELRDRAEAAAGTLGHLAASLLIGVAGLAVLVVALVGAALSIVWVGLPLLQLALAAARWLAGAERRDVNRFLDAHVPPLPRLGRRPDGRWRRVTESLADPWQHRVLALMALRAPLTLAALA
ncbi:MAG TPA: sensor domain-containing protein, partial [Solirubrobacteraceae bacterium]|nr:sensor domain-containing protein [Solirubrobacteraceae bacterium]